jgi:hypothetical protein
MQITGQEPEMADFLGFISVDFCMQTAGHEKAASEGGFHFADRQKFTSPSGRG